MGIRNGTRWQAKPPLGSGLDASAPLARGLLLRPPLNEGAGNQLADLVPGGKGGTISGATWAAGKFGPALSFNGSTAFASGVGVKVGGLVAVSASVWFRTTTSQANYPFHVPSDSAGSNGLDFRTTTAGVVIGDVAWVNPGNQQVGLASPSYTVPGGYADGAWHHLAVTWDGSTATLHYDGAKVASAATGLGAPAGVSQANNAIGEWDLGRFGTFGRYWNGSLDLPAVWGWCLGAGDVAEVYRRPFADVAPPGPRRTFAMPAAPAFAATAAGTIATPAGSATIGLANAYGASAAAMLATPAGSASPGLASVANASATLAAPSGSAAVALADAYSVSAAAAPAAPAGSASPGLAFAATAAAALATPAGSAAVGLVDTFSSSAAATLAAPAGSAAVGLGFPGSFASSASASLATPAGSAAIGAADAFGATLAATLAAPSGSAAIVAAGPATFDVAAAGSLDAPAGVAGIDLVDTFASVAAATLATPAGSAGLDAVGAVTFVAPTSLTAAATLAPGQVDPARTIVTDA